MVVYMSKLVGGGRCVRAKPTFPARHPSTKPTQGPAAVEWCGEGGECEWGGRGAVGLGEKYEEGALPLPCLAHTTWKRFWD